MALATADIHVKIDPLVKKKAEKKFKEIGITMSDFINLELRRIIREDKAAAEIVDEALPDNLRITSVDDLVTLLRKRESEDSNRNYSSEQMKTMLSERLKTKI
ncbi:type II toxin-antitoxin system RelB/DinJ family antitoxin [Candidatus Saccharibacteria bacterium]|nr:type II toxin-antitoxin system RelB/DinJ family antitoxin [Candidatus Saccharibacteria bacterium]